MSLVSYASCAHLLQIFIINTFIEEDLRILKARVHCLCHVAISKKGRLRFLNIIQVKNLSVANLHVEHGSQNCTGGGSTRTTSSYTSCSTQDDHQDAVVNTYRLHRQGTNLVNGIPATTPLSHVHPVRMKEQELDENNCKT